MRIELRDIGKEYDYQWVFRGLNADFQKGNAYGIAGPNGSGKSTLLSIIAGLVTPTAGQRKYERSDGGEVRLEDLYKYLSWSGPYQEIIEQYTLREFLQFHSKFKPFRNGLQLEEVIELIELASGNKVIRQFSSGMKQRVKLATAILSQADIVLIDEPGTNLDEAALQWYLRLRETYLKDALVIVASNSDRDFGHVQKMIRMEAYTSKATL